MPDDDDDSSMLSAIKSTSVAEGGAIAARIASRVLGVTPAGRLAGTVIGGFVANELSKAANKKRSDGDD